MTEGDVTWDPECVFCERIEADQVVARSHHAVAFPDRYPISPGHTLVVSRRHEPDFFALTEEERLDLWSLVDQVRHHLDARYGPDAFNIGVNAGRAAGQTVAHAHVHVIPRYQGDVGDPRGGIRHLIPDEAVYWEEDGEDEPGR